MAKIHYIETVTAQNKYTGAPMDALIALIDKRITDLLEKFRTLECVARGGESLANSLDAEGDPVDVISGGIFRAIINATIDISAYNDLREAVTELRRLAT